MLFLRYASRQDKHRDKPIATFRTRSDFFTPAVPVTVTVTVLDGGPDLPSEKETSPAVGWTENFRLAYFFVILNSSLLLADVDHPSSCQLHCGNSKAVAAHELTV